MYGILIMARMQKLYTTEILPKLQKELGYDSVMAVPKIKKITLNMGLGEAVANKNVLQNASDDIMKICGQKPVITKARKSEAAFKIREGWPIGVKVTLRRERMYEFLDRLISVAVPRMRDFRGLSNKSFDGMGNYSFGIKEQIVFPEIDYDHIDALRGLDICITTSARNDDDARALMRAFNFPIRY